MKALLYTLLGVALVTSLGFASILQLQDQDNEDLQSAITFPYITYVEDVYVDELIIQLKGQTDDTKLSLIQYFILQQRKFLNFNAIQKILQVGGEHSIIVMKPYIAPLNMNETSLLFSMCHYENGIGSSVFISQLYDFNKYQYSFESVSYRLDLAGKQNGNLYYWPQFNKIFTYNFLITSEGRHVGFLFDQSENMNTVAYISANYTTITRYQMLKQFYVVSQDIFQNFYTLSYVVTGNRTNQSCLSCAIGSYQVLRPLNNAVQNALSGGGENDIYSKLSQLLAQPYSQLSDVYILSTGIVTSGTQDLNDFIKLIDQTNSQTRNKIRINTVSFLVGGSEPQLVKSHATFLLQGLADYTGGTFIQVYPELD